MESSACSRGSRRPCRGQSLSQGGLRSQNKGISDKHQVWYQPREEQKGICPRKSYRDVNASHQNQQSLSLSGQPCYLIPQKTKDKGWHCISSVTQAISQVMACEVHYSRMSIKTLGRKLCKALRFQIL